MTWSTTLFIITFLSQVFLLSYYFPGKLLARLQHVMSSYPPSTHPKLYPKPVEYYKLGYLAFKLITRAIFWLGLVLAVLILFVIDHSTFADHGHVSKFWPSAYGLLQFLPLMALEFSEFRHFRMMRDADPKRKRVADLKRRGLFNLVSPGLVIAAVLTFALAILFDLFVHDFTVSLGHDTMQRAITMTVTNVMLAIVGAWSLYGRKPDPYQSGKDRTQRLTVNLESLLFVSMALSAFIAITAADDLVRLDAIDATIMSVYFQVIAVFSLGYTLRNIDPRDMDFDVYRADPGLDDGAAEAGIKH